MTVKTARQHRELIKEAAAALSDLNVLASIVAILEGGTVSADVQPTDFKIIKICQAEMNRCLRRFDRACAALGAPYRARAALSHLHSDEAK